MSFKINDSERKKLQAPLSKVYTENEVIDLVKKSEYKIISVGDYTTLMLLKSGLNPFISVIDFKMSRVPVKDMNKFILDEYFHKADMCINKPGFIEECALNWVKEHISIGGRMIVEGEEDLVAIPLIYYMDENTVLLYGQRNEGTVVIFGNEKTKNKNISNTIENIMKRLNEEQNKE